MSILNLPHHPGLKSTTRLRALTSGSEVISGREWLILFLAGGLAAYASVMVEFGLRIPGHAILRVVFPMAVGLALVPRRGAGLAMGGFAFLTALGLTGSGISGEPLSFGATTSLTITGPILDWTLRRTNGGWKQYWAFALAGLTSNLIAFAVKASSKAFSNGLLPHKQLAVWFPKAVVTYTICGILAGLISGSVWFYARKKQEPITNQDERP